MGRDPLFYSALQMNVYGYVGSQPTVAVDPSGEVVYLLDGTWSTDGINFGSETNVSAFGRFIDSMKETVRSYDGSNLTGTNVGLIHMNVTTQICDDYCKVMSRGMRPEKINLVGWSRGAVIALSAAYTIETKGCCCDRSWLGCCRHRYYPWVNWIGLFDAVNMTWSSIAPPGEGGNMYTQCVADSCSHARKSGSEVIFPTIDLPGVTFWNFDGSDTTHGDIGIAGRKNDSLLWMINKAYNMGVSIREDAFPEGGFPIHNAAPLDSGI